MPNMKDFLEYDKAKSVYLGNLSLNRNPLVSWDFFGAFLQEINRDFSDLKELEGLTTAHNWISDFDFKKELQEENVIVVTDPKLKIVFASHTILKMTGYQSQEIIGESPKLFQGKATSLKTSAEIKMAIQNLQPFEKTVVNYRKTGEIYDCHIKGFPVFNKKGKLSHFIAFEKVA